jgi:hypothetical protein
MLADDRPRRIREPRGEVDQLPGAWFGHVGESDADRRRLKGGAGDARDRNDRARPRKPQ